MNDLDMRKGFVVASSDITQCPPLVRYALELFADLKSQAPDCPFDFVHFFEEEQKRHHVVGFLNFPKEVLSCIDRLNGVAVITIPEGEYPDGHIGMGVFAVDDVDPISFALNGGDDFSKLTWRHPNFGKAIDDEVVIFVRMYMEGHPAHARIIEQQRIGLRSPVSVTAPAAAPQTPEA